MKHKLEFFLFNRLKQLFSDIIPDRLPDNDVIIGLATSPASNDVIIGLALLYFGLMTPCYKSSCNPSLRGNEGLL
jgi:hypothetical protein